MPKAHCGAGYNVGSAVVVEDLNNTFIFSCITDFSAHKKSGSET